MSKFWRWFEAVALAFNLGLSVNLVLIFFAAAIWGGGKATVWTNKFGEQTIEMVVFPIWLAMGFITLIRMARRL